MINRYKINHSSIYIIIFISFALSLLVSNHNLTNYDKNILKNNRFSHLMIKNDAERYLGHGALIKKEILEGKNYFKSGRENYTKYLPPRIAAAYYLLLDKDLYDNFVDKKINIGNHKPYLFIQCLIYYLSILFLYQSIKKKFNNRTNFFIVCFLCLEVTIFQYNGSFFSETIFFSIQILLMSLILRENKSLFNFFLIGIFLGLLSLQKQMAIFYIVPVILYFLFPINASIIKKIAFLIIGFYIVQSFLGYHNFQRSGKFYLLTADNKLDLHIDLVSRVISKKENISKINFNINEGKISLKWIDENFIKIDQISLALKLEKNLKVYGIKSKGATFMDVRASIINENDKIKYDNFIALRTIEYLKDNPFIFLKYIIKQSFHIALLNPFHVYSYYNFESGEKYYASDTHDKLIPYRIIYSLTIYLICFFGLIRMINNKNYKMLFFLISSIIYFYGLVSWHGNTRYFVPTLIYLSFFFGLGIDAIIKKTKDHSSNNLNLSKKL
jgi:hypothetical protein